MRQGGGGVNKMMMMMVVGIMHRSLALQKRTKEKWNILHKDMRKPPNLDPIQTETP